MKHLVWLQLLLLGVHCTASESSAEPTQERPNILWITAEDMSPTLGCWGDEYAHTPNIDAFAARSVRYTKAFATAPVCSPVRSTLITGRYATSMGTQRLRSRFPLPQGVQAWPAYLRRAGYYCTNNVKTDYNTSDEQKLIRQAWNKNSNKAHWRGRAKGQPFFAIFNDMVSHQSRTMVWPYEQFKQQVQSQLSPEEIHDPANAPIPPWYPDTPIIRRTIARTYDCQTAMDKNTGRILDQLEQDGLADDTIVFFYADHGTGLPRGKRVLQDSGLHVPLLIHFPEKYAHLAPASPGESLDRLVSFVDFPPTILSLLGLPIPDYMQGTAFLGKSEGPPRTHVFGARDRVDEAFDLARSARDGRYLYIRTYMPHLSYNQPSSYPDLGEIRDEITALARAGKLAPGPQTDYAGPHRPREEFYDTEADPQQINNLIGNPNHVDRIATLRTRLRRWMIQVSDRGFLAEPDAWRRKGNPLKALVAAASLVGQGVHVQPQQVALLSDADPSIRYWGAVGLTAQKNPPAEPLRKALDDNAPFVRVEAAAALAKAGELDRALEVLRRELGGANLDVALHASRAIELLGVKARAAKPAMQKALERSTDKPGDRHMMLRFSTQAFLDELNR